MRGFPDRAPIRTAKELVEENGQSLIGRVVNTAPVGWWPGGLAEVVGLAPDPESAPEIVFEVRALPSNWKVRNAVAYGKLDDETIGVFENEEVHLI